jgi:hypothetical protein
MSPTELTRMKTLNTVVCGQDRSGFTQCSVPHLTSPCHTGCLLEVPVFTTSPQIYLLKKNVFKLQTVGKCAWLTHSKPQYEPRHPEASSRA